MSECYISIELVGGTNDGRTLKVPADEHMRPKDIGSDLCVAIHRPLSIEPLDPTTYPEPSPVESYRPRLAPSDDQVWRYDYVGRRE